jgi:hypothetical protein
MKRRFFVVFTLLIVASLLAAMGTGAIDFFRAERAAAMQVVNDGDGLIALTGDGNYAKEDSKGRLELDFTDKNISFLGKGFNPKAISKFNNVFKVTNKSAKTVYVWLEAEGWTLRHDNGLTYKVDKTYGDAKVHPGYTNVLLDKYFSNFKGGFGNAAYVELPPGASFDVKIYVDTVTDDYLDEGRNIWDHKVIVRANKNKPGWFGPFEADSANGEEG